MLTTAPRTIAEVIVNKPVHIVRNRRPRGWSLVEALVGTAVASTMASVAVPNMIQVKQSMAVQTSVQELVTALQLARSEAIRSGQRVAVSPQQGNDWSSGWNVFVDGNDDGVRGAGEPVVRAYAPRAAGLSMTPFFGAGVDGSVLSFTPEGVIRRPGSRGLVLGRIRVKQADSVQSVCMASARIRTIKSEHCE